MEHNENNTMPMPKIKHDWYQTETFVTVTILAKNSKDVKVSFGETTLSVSAKLPSGSDYSLELDLPHTVVPDECSYTVKPSKIEINLKKQESYKWDTLESSSTEQKTVQPIPQEILQGNSQPPQYPSCSKKSKDWDKVEKEIEKQEAEEEPEGEAALRALLVKIYNQGSDQVKRAMIKSFTESGGTVLSTDWSEVGKKPVERKPPAGMDWKPWNT